ncbi:MAG: hypothetical protein NTX86_04805 [Candidatus Dependentiae bacterium]|nr:hypothetical protein [Candidatus Dependentiae bacterium]
MQTHALPLGYAAITTYSLSKIGRRKNDTLNVPEFRDPASF